MPRNGPLGKQGGPGPRSRLGQAARGVVLIHERSLVGPNFTSPTALTEPLGPRLTGMFAVLRRATGPDDELPPINPLGEDLSFELRSYYPAYIRRVAQDADGERYFVIPGFERALRIPPARCLPRELRRHRAQLVDVPTYVVNG